MTVAIEVPQAVVQLTKSEIRFAAAIVREHRVGDFRRDSIWNPTSGSWSFTPEEEVVIVAELRRLRERATDQGDRRVLTILRSKIEGKHAEMERVRTEREAMQLVIDRNRVEAGFKAPTFEVTVGRGTNNGRNVIEIALERTDMTFGNWREFTTEISPEFNDENEVVFRLGRWGQTPTTFATKEEAVTAGEAQAWEFAAERIRSARAEFDRVAQRVAEAK